MPDHDIAVSVRDLSKSYTIAHEDQKHTLATEALLQSIKNIGKKQTTETFWALKDVSFDIAKGDVVGIIGRNGAGKSTLLKILSRITEPTSGQIDLYGRVGSLLEVGTGFHPELTGRENTYLNGAILGMSKKEIAKHFDAIVDFSGVEKFLDTPVKRYSSGMYVRLAFAVAAHLEPEILIVDEVLAVGDAEFQKKCLGKMQDVANHGRTVIFVSHNMGAVVNLCTKAILMQSGVMKLYDRCDRVVSKYLEHNTATSDARLLHNLNPTSSVAFTHIWVTDDNDNPSSALDVNKKFYINISILSRQEVRDIEITALFYNSNEQCLFMTSISDRGKQFLTLETGPHSFSVQVPKHFLASDTYSVSVIAHKPNVEIIDQYDHIIKFDIEETGSNISAYKGTKFGNILVDFDWAYTDRTRYKDDAINLVK